MSSKRKRGSHNRADHNLVTEAKRHISLTDVLEKLTDVMGEMHELHRFELMCMMYPCHGDKPKKDLERIDALDAAAVEAVNAVARLLWAIDNNMDLFALGEVDVDGRPKLGSD